MSNGEATPGVWKGARLFIWSSLIRVPWLCGYNVAAAVLLVVLFAANEQGLDLLRVLSSRPLVDREMPWNLLFIITTAVLSVGLWYSSRLLLGREFPAYRLDPVFAAFGRRWIPRILGSIVPLAIAVGFYRVAGSSSPLAAIFLGMGIFLLVFYIVRRQVLPADLTPRLRKPLKLLVPLHVYT
jgi:hypothetical protein